MLTRRDVLLGAAAAAGLRLPAPAGEPATSAEVVSFAVPPGACDCHTHVFGDPARFPFTATRTYTPGAALVGEMRAMHGSLHAERVVVCPPSVYGTDNGCTLDALRQLGTRARGVALSREVTADDQLDRPARAGIPGV